MSYQWYRQLPEDKSHSAIPGATGSSYQISEADQHESAKLSVSLSYEDDGGTKEEVFSSNFIQLIKLDITEITPPSRPDLTPSADSGSSSSDNLTSYIQPSFTGTAEPVTSVELFVGTTSRGSTTTNDDGNWSFTIPESAALSDGSTAITAIATDAAGHASPSSAALNLTIDTIAPTFAAAATTTDGTKVVLT